MKPLCQVIAVLLTLATLFCAEAPAGEVLRSSVGHASGEYTLHLEMRVQGEPELLRKLITDFDHLGQLNRTIVESRRLASDKPRVEKMRVVMQECLFLFCPRLVQTQEVRQTDNGDLMVTIVPEESDYEKGSSLWQFVEESPGLTRVTVEARMTPRLLIPPLLGPPIVADLLFRRSLDMMNNLERLATSVAAVSSSAEKS
ncbi:MAG: SRPBCC family protein [Magnetococcales bacterium]|nr:SRPBCC family protein [Magnetococcales bacterium]